MADAKSVTASKSKQFKHNKPSDRRAKRAAARPFKSKNTVLVHRKSDFKSQLERCQRLLEKEEDEIQIHGLGAAINRAVNMALQLQLRAKGSLKLITTTSTVDLVDDFESVQEEHAKATRRNGIDLMMPKVRTENGKKDIDPYSKSRSCSAIHIILRKIPLDKLIADKDK